MVPPLRLMIDRVRDTRGAARAMTLASGLVVMTVLVATIVANGGPGTTTPTPTPTPTSTATPTATSVSCDRNATTSTFATQISAATAGQTVCLATGSYGNWSVPNKSSPGITVKEQASATATFNDLTFRTSAWVTIDGIDYVGGDMCGPTHDVTIKNAEQSGFFQVAAGAGPAQNNTCTSAPQMSDSNVVWDNVDFTLDACPDGSCLTNEGRISFIFGSTVDADITIQNSTFTGNCGDGIQVGGSSNAGRGLRVLNNEWVNLTQQGCVDVFPGPDQNAPHTDSFQFVGGCCVTFQGNWFHNISTGIVKYDGTGGGITITNNVFGPSIGGDALCLGGTAGATITHNTFRSGGLYLCVNHDSSPNSSVVWQNNIQHQNPTVQGSSGYAAGSPNYNVCTAGTCPGANSLNGSVSFLGGATPIAFTGWALASGSRGKAAASDGTDIGVNP